MKLLKIFLAAVMIIVLFAACWQPLDFIPGDGYKPLPTRATSPEIEYNAEFLAGELDRSKDSLLYAARILDGLGAKEIADIEIEKVVINDNSFYYVVRITDKIDDSYSFTLSKWGGEPGSISKNGKRVWDPPPE